jgi:hypothetical protein
MIWLTVTESLCLRYVFKSFPSLVHELSSNKLFNMTGVLSGTWAAYSEITCVLVRFLLFALSNYRSPRFQLRVVMSATISFRLYSKYLKGFHVFFYVICIHLSVIVSNTISFSNDVRVV